LTEPTDSSVGPTPGCRCEDGRGSMRRSVVFAAGAELVSTSINSLALQPLADSDLYVSALRDAAMPCCLQTIATTGSDACGALGLGLLGRLSATRSWGV
jgi:hypothetical protein